MRHKIKSENFLFFFCCNKNFFFFVINYVSSIVQSLKRGEMIHESSVTILLCELDLTKEKISIVISYHQLSYSISGRLQTKRKNFLFLIFDLDVLAVRVTCKQIEVHGVLTSKCKLSGTSCRYTYLVLIEYSEYSLWVCSL